MTGDQEGVDDWTQWENLEDFEAWVLRRLQEAEGASE